MRVLSRPLTLAALAGASLCLWGCESDDVGQPCADEEATSIGDTPISGEQPWVEVVRMQRDGACESFKCLRHEGLSPYCTRECEFIEGEEGGGECTTDDDCSGDTNCADEGICRLDDCPAGFKCAGIQTVGPLAEDVYCVRRIDCEENLDCRSLGTIGCVEHACYDRCLALASSETCDFHEKVCEPVDEFLAHIECSCANPTLDFTECTDESVLCKATNSPTDPWDPGSAFERLGVCLLEEDDETDSGTGGTGGDGGTGGGGGGAGGGAG